MAFAELSDVRCYYEILGRGDPLLLIPGLGSTCRSYDPVLTQLAEHFSVILIDNRGVGRSQPRRHANSLSALAADLVELLDFLQLDSTHVLGLSLGGMIAQQFASDHPARLRRLVLVSCTDRFTPYLRQLTRVLGQALRHLPWRTFLEMVELLGTAPQFLDAHADEAAERMKCKLQAGISRRAVARQLLCLTHREIDPDKYSIVAPTLVIAGDQDVLIPSDYALRMADKIPDSQFMLIEGAGHNPLEECPERVLPRIVEFFKEGDYRKERHQHKEFHAQSHRGNAAMVESA